MEKMKKLILVYNPVSGDASFKNKLDRMLEQFQQRNCMLLIYRTRRDNRGIFAEFVRTADAEGIIVAGGDGTVHEIVNLVLQENIKLPVAIIGSGTSNDFATYLGINDDLDAYFDRIAAGHTRRVDLGRVVKEYFVNVASAGMLTGIAHEVDVRLKNAMGKMAYYLRGIGEIPKFRSVHLQVEADGRMLEEDAFLFVVVNSGVVGSLRNVAVNAKVDDGLLDMLLVRKCNVAELMALTAEIVAGRSVEHKENVLYLQASSFKITADTKLESDLDGECGPDLPLVIETIPKALEIYD